MVNVAAAEPIPAFLDRKPVIYTYTFLKTYRDICAHQAGRKYIVRDIPYKETPEMKRGNDVHRALELRLQGKPLPDGMQDYEQFAAGFAGLKTQTEPELACSRTGKPVGYWDNKTSDPDKLVWLRGRADVVVLNGPKAYLLDWKTGKTREEEFELEVQALLLKIKYPELQQVVGQYAWLKDLTLGKLYDLSNFRQTWDEVNRIVDMIEHDRARGVFEKRQSGLCGYCDVRDCRLNTNPRPA